MVSTRPGARTWTNEDDICFLCFVGDSQDLPRTSRHGPGPMRSDLLTQAPRKPRLARKGVGASRGKRSADLIGCSRIPSRLIVLGGIPADCQQCHSPLSSCSQGPEPSLKHALSAAVSLWLARATAKSQKDNRGVGGGPNLKWHHLKTSRWTT
jgi:hypothetical protein